jgi:triacylglycerol esterase/lipase EstA (alpha/beta hydrolase family)
VLSSLAPARRRLVLALAAVVLVAVAAAVLVALVNRDPPVRQTAQATAGPVVLVPGYGGDTASLRQLAAMLRAHGKDTTVVTLPGDGRGDLDAQAQALGTAVGAVLRRTGAPTVDVIGYSAGGVVARLWVRDHGGATRARRVVTLGSPHHGTDVAALAGGLAPGACPTACRQLATDSVLLARLNAGDETPPGPTWVSIWTTRDRVVVPPGSAELSGALDFTVQSVCPADEVDHGGLPADRYVAAMVLAVLSAGPARQPASCTPLSS